MLFLKCFLSYLIYCGIFGFIFKVFSFLLLSIIYMIVCCSVEN